MLNEIKTFLKESLHIKIKENIFLQVSLIIIISAIVWIASSCVVLAAENNIAAQYNTCLKNIQLQGESECSSVAVNVKIMEDKKTLMVEDSDSIKEETLNEKIEEKNKEKEESAKAYAEEQAEAIAAAEAAKTDGDRAAELAESYVGILPYNWGCSTLDPYIGADCSGFTSAVYRAIGYDWVSTGSDYQAYQGYSVLNEEWLPGDIIIYYGHVAMYIGNGTMVHCPDVGRYVEYGNPWYTTILDVRRIAN